MDGHDRGAAFTALEAALAISPLAVALAKQGRLEEAGRAAARVLELHPTFRFSRQFAGVNCAPELADALGDALRLAGLPE